MVILVYLGFVHLHSQLLRFLFRVILTSWLIIIFLLGNTFSSFSNYLFVCLYLLFNFYNLEIYHENSIVKKESINLFIQKLRCL